MNINLIKKKLIQIDSYIQELEALVLSHSPEEVKREATLLHTAERLVQLLVDTMIDINIHLLISKEMTYDKTQSTFLLLGKMKVLPENFARKIAPIVGLRNILVYRYEELNKDLFIRNLFNNKNDFKTYLVAIHDFVRKEQQNRSKKEKGRLPLFSRIL